MSPLQQVIWELHNQGMGAKRIAARLRKRPDNIKTQLRRIKAKINVPNKEYNDDIDDILPKLETQQSQIEFLASRGYATRQIAERTGASANVISAQKWRGRQEKSRVRRYFMAPEEIEALFGVKSSFDPEASFDSGAARMLFRIFVEEDRVTRETLAALGAQGLGGWPAKKAALSDRAKMLKVLAAAGREKALLKVTAKEGLWYRLVEDMLDKYRKIDNYTYIPDAWDLHEKEVNNRINAALATVKINAIGYKEGVEVYELSEQKETAVVIRPLDGNQAAIVATAWKQAGKLGKKGVEGPVSKDVAGFKIDGQQVDPAGVVFSRQGERWLALDLGLLRKGDVVRLRGDSIVEIVRWNEQLPKVKAIRLEGDGLVWGVAAFVIKKECWILAGNKLYDFRRLSVKQKRGA